VERGNPPHSHTITGKSTHTGFWRPNHIIGSTPPQSLGLSALNFDNKMHSPTQDRPRQQKSGPNTQHLRGMYILLYPKHKNAYAVRHLLAVQNQPTIPQYSSPTSEVIHRNLDPSRTFENFTLKLVNMDSNAHTPYVQATYVSSRSR